jgi:hypothetical protein
MAISFKELDGSPTESFGVDGPKAQRRILVAWEERHAMIAELLGQGYQSGGTSPASYPLWANALAMAVRLEPWPSCPEDQGAFDDVASQLNSYSDQYARITIDYELLYASASRGDLPQPDSGTVLTYRMDCGGEQAIVSGEGLQWVADASLPVPPEVIPVVRVPIAEHHLTWHRVISPPWDAIRNSLGTVNDDTFLGAAAETLLLDGVTADKQFLGIDDFQQPQFGWRIGYVFREKTIHWGGNTYGWNYAYCCLPQNSPAWDKLVDSQGESLYRTSAFGPLFQLA